MTAMDDDEDDERQKGESADIGVPDEGYSTQTKGTGAQPEVQRTFQPQQSATPGQRTPMPWGGGTQQGGATPWAGAAMAQRPQMPQAGGGQGGGMPNWAAIQARFGGQGGGAPQGPGGPPQGGAPGGGMRLPFGLGQGGMGGQQGNPWLQQMMAQAAQRIRGGMGMGQGGPQGGPSPWGPQPGAAPAPPPTAPIGGGPTAPPAQQGNPIIPQDPRFRWGGGGYR